MLNIRAKAAKILSQVITQGQSLDPQFNNLSVTNEKDLSLIKNICFGSLRSYFLYNEIIKELVKKIKPKDNIIRLLLVAGFYQLEHTRMPAYAVISESVEACKQLKKPFFTGVVNKVLRVFDQEKQALITKAQQRTIEALYNHPLWLINQIKQDYPEQWQAILTANNQQPPLWLRINQQKTTADEFTALLTAQSIAFEQHGPFSLRLLEPMAIEKIPGYQAGLFWVQDLAGQQLEQMINLKPGMRVLDACAAPGSKTALMLAIEPTIELTALDISDKRLLRLKENLARLGLEKGVTVQAGDSAKPSDWWDNKPFDLILIDAPCSGTGVIRRHPDIKLLRTQADIQPLAQTQLELINALLPLLSPTGTMIYSTCSILSTENQQVIKALSSNLPTTKINLAIGSAQEIGWQILPQENLADGFFYANKLSINPGIRND